MKASFTLLFILLLSSTAVFSQSIGISDSASLPDSSAILDVSSIKKGVLLPRMTQAQRLAIPSPAKGLIVYQTDGNTGFYFNSGTRTQPVWVLYPDVNAPPTIVLTSDTAITLNRQLDSIRLNGMATDRDGTVKSYLWSEINGPNTATIHRQGSDTVFISNLTSGLYTFQLMATDDRGAVSVKSIRVSVSVPALVNLSRGLLAYYPFNGNVNDESGNGNNGTLYNSPEISSDKKGNAASALSLNGTNCVIVTDSGRLNPTDSMSISFDVMMRQTGPQQNFVTRLNFNSGWGATYGVAANITGTTLVQFGTTVSGISCDKFEQANEVGGNVVGTELQKEIWYTIAATYKSGVHKIYINGVLVAMTTAATAKILYCTNANLIIGGWWKNALGGLNGKIDNVRIYNRVLNDAEIQALQN